MDEKNDRWYWSNCIIEAVRAKVRNPNVKILVIWPWNNEAFCMHLAWTDGQSEYDFHARGVPVYGWIWHKGYIREKPLGWTQSYIDGMKTLRRLRRTARFSR